jgi:ribosome recycling factor
MDSAIETLRKEFSGLRTGRASPALLEPIRVEAYGSNQPLNQVANISVSGPGLLSVQVWDKSVAKAVEVAIRDSGLGLNPQAEGQVIRVPLPPLTQERRNDLAKTAAKYAEASKVAIRGVRRDGMEQAKAAEKDKKAPISQDEAKMWSEEVQKLTDQYIRQIDQLLAEKEKDIRQV